MLLFLQSFFTFCLLYDRLDCIIITKNHGWVLASRSSKSWPVKIHLQIRKSAFVSWDWGIPWKTSFRLTSLWALNLPNMNMNNVS
jgi:hypothetical protein